MLGKRPRPFLRTTSKSQLIPGYGNEFLPPEVEEKLVLGASHHVVIGFDLGTEKKQHQHGDVCESPRSVLESNALCESVHLQQARSPRSPCSVLGSLLSGQHCQHPPCKEGVGLGIVAAIKAQEDAKVAKLEEFKASLKSEPIPITGQNHVPPLQKQWKNQGPGHLAGVGEGRVASPYHTPSKVLGEDRYGGDDDDEGDDDDDMGIRESIFSTASPASNYCSIDFPGLDFLSVCFFCRRRLVQGKDIYMYRGDQAFCSTECRYQQIVIDERKERRSAAANCYSRASTHNNSRVLAATPAAVA